MAKGIKLFITHSLKRVLLCGFISYTLIVSVAYGYMAFNAVHQVENQVAQMRIEQVHHKLKHQMRGVNETDLAAAITAFNDAELPYYPGLSINLATDQKLDVRLSSLPLGMHDDVAALELHVFVTALPGIEQAIIYSYAEDNVSSVNQQERHFISKLVFIGLVIMLSGVLLAVLLSRRITNPLNKLALALLSPNNSTELPCSQRRDELGILSRNMAALLQRNEQFLIREQQFSRHCSHELRTPVAIIQNSLSVLKMPHCNVKLAQRSISRIEAATTEMASLINTFLLLGRTTDVSQTCAISLNLICEEIIEHLNHTLPQQVSNKTIELKGHVTIISQLSILKVLVTNVIRNAFTHSKNNIIIECLENKLIISNDIDDHGTDGGYGYGLEIISRMATSLSCDVTFDETHSEYRVCITFPPLSPEHK